MIVSIISPCLNEAGYINDYVEAALAQQCRGFELEVIIADGQSDDGTREKLEDWICREPRLRKINNPGGTVSKGLNLALHESRGEVIVRMDIHTTYAPDYVAECVEALQQTGATCVGGPWVAKGEGLVQRAIARAFQSPFGSGGAASRNAFHNGPVDTVYLGAWRRADLLAIGGFDESLVRNQDDELNMRILRAGGRVWQSSAIRSEYRPRASLTALFRQFIQYGYWKVPVIRKHQLPASLRHLVPFGFVLWIVLLALASTFSTIAQIALVVTLLVYTAGALSTAFLVKDEDRNLHCMAITALALFCMHAGYGLGFGRALWDFAVLKRGAAKTMCRLTR